ncbi:MAG: redoxin domain-containing protein [Verrucomicrobia bacterium]|nr:redoxin domain-containing protein [Verrucomicrobiota bacterium]
MIHPASSLATLGALAALLRVLPAAELGDPAAPLEISAWIRGNPVNLDAVRGRNVVVVEFWATWCGPCRVTIPHLAELQRKFRDRGVVVVGISDESAAKVQPFVDAMAEKMEYTVALDTQRNTFAGYMGAYGVRGIPHAFVVDLQGRVAWHGHPMSGLAQALERIAPTTAPAPPAANPKRAEAQRALRNYLERAARGDSDERLEPLGRQLAALDKDLGGLEPGKPLNLAELRTRARFEAAMRDYQRALTSGKAQPELDALEAKARPLAPAGFNFARFKGQYQLQRLFQDYYRAVTGKGDSAKAESIAQQLDALESDDVEVQNEIAWTLLTDERIKSRNPKLALKFARAACQASGGQDPNVLDTYARALFDNGNVPEAIRQQTRAIELNTDPDRKADLEEALRRYRQKAPSS